MTKMIIKDLVTRAPISIDGNSSIVDACRLMKKESVGSLLVLIDSVARGIVTERDVVYAIADGVPLTEKVLSIMSSNLVTVDSTTDVSDVALIMTSRKIRHLAVVEGGKIIGVISLRDVARALGLVTADLSVW
ncbi:MAG: CBS domain-containing protein [Candidatus Aramenus sulfurataquae]|uniref:CBS domain-containing protein n=1 Tax=Candidatus Aramenus sulfurataquae TaxID=1326980 RepID=A0ACC6TNP5_9CREN